VRELPRLQGKLNLNVHIRRSEEYLNRLISTVVTQPEIQSRINESRISVEEYECGIHSAALSMLKELDSSIRGGRNPFILAVSSIYAADRKVSESRGIKPILTQRILARATGTAEYSLRDHFCSLLKKKCNSASKKENEQVSVNKPQRE
jgi:transcription initiation factor TFIIIB Brf1 subunit/transcription initiation factor TFIIB